MSLRRFLRQITVSFKITIKFDVDLSFVIQVRSEKDLRSHAYCVWLTKRWSITVGH